MTKILALLLALVLCCGVACAQAATLTMDSAQAVKMMTPGDRSRRAPLARP